MARTRRHIPVIAAVAVLLRAQTSHGTSETAVQVAQPMVIEEEIFVSAVTYSHSRYLGSHIAGYAASLVSAPNGVVGEDGATQNRNAASIAGIGVRTMSAFSARA